MASTRSNASSSTVLRHPHPANKRSHSSSNLLSNTVTGKQHSNLSGFTSVNDSGTSPAAVAAAPTNKRRQSTTHDTPGHDDGSVHHATSTSSARIGPKRKSKVGISGLSSHGHGHGGHHGHHVHGMTGMTRKNNASSSALAAKKDRARSHASLANLAGEMAAAYAEADHHASTSSSTTTAMMKSRSKQQKQKERAAIEADDSQANEGEVEGEGDVEGEGWISANSSAAVSPEQGASPISPESFKALEFGKKNRRGNKGKAAAAAALPELNFDKQQVKVPEQVQVQQEKETEEEENVLGTTPKQSSSAGGAAGLAGSLSASVGLIQAAKYDQSQDRLGASVQEGDEDVTPSVEKTAEHGGLTTPRLSDESNEASNTHPTLPDSPVQLPEQTATHPKQEASQDLPSDLPQPLPHHRPQMLNLRKASSSTIRTMASLTAGGARPPLTPGMRKATAPLQPRLDTKSEGLGEILEQNIGSPTTLGADGTGTEQSIKGSRNDVPFPAAGKEAGDLGNVAAPTKPRHGRSISGNAGGASKAGTLTASEAEDLARRLRSVSGTDLHRMDGSGTFRSTSGGGRDARASLRRSASSSLGFTLSGMTAAGPPSPRAETSGGGAFGTLKRASGYFGSIGRLAGLAGLTSTASNTSNSPPSPSVTTFPGSGGGNRKSPGSGGNQSPAQAALMQNSPSAGGGANGKGKGRQSTGPAAGSSKAVQQQQYRPPPLISKFIETTRGGRMTFAEQPPATTNSGAGHSGVSNGEGSKGRGTVSRARAKMMTQRDAPFPYSEYDDQQLLNSLGDMPHTPNGIRGGGSSSAEDLSSASASASHLNLRALSSSRQGQQGQHTPGGGANQPLAKEVQRWILALAKEAERIDKEHQSNSRWRDELNASFARVLVKKEREEEEDRREREKEIREQAKEDAAKAQAQAQAGKSSRPSSVRSKTAR